MRQLFLKSYKHKFIYLCICMEFYTMDSDYVTFSMFLPVQHRRNLA